VEGNEAVKTGSKIAARYSASIGEALEDAMIVPGPGRRLAFCARELHLSISILKSLSGVHTLS
jgi:hypothetical protein